MVLPLFSCVVPVKGDRPFIGEALDSLELQGFGDKLEIIVQDGDIEHDSGQSDALNKGFAKAHGEWLFWLNADDVLLPGSLTKVEELIANSLHNKTPLNWISGDTVYMDESGSVMDVRTDARWRPWFGKKLSAWTGGPAAFFRRSLWSRLGGLDVELKYVMDIDLWTRWARSGECFVSVRDYLWGFRMHPGSATMGGRNEAAHRAEKMMLLARHGIGQQGFWRNVTRMMSVMDGSLFRRICDSHRFRGKHWQEIAR